MNKMCYILCEVDKSSQPTGKAVTVKKANWEGNWPARYFGDGADAVAYAIYPNDMAEGIPYCWDLVDCNGGHYDLLAVNKTDEEIEDAKKFLLNRFDVVGISVIRLHELIELSGAEEKESKNMDEKINNNIAPAVQKLREAANVLSEDFTRVNVTERHRKLLATFLAHDDIERNQIAQLVFLFAAALENQ